MTNQITFPESFIERPHPLFKSGKQWTLKTNRREISIVGGGGGLYGNGVTTFEYWDYSEDRPIGFLTKEEINEKLSQLTF